MRKVELNIDGYIANIELNNPPANALDKELIDQLEEAVDQVNSNDGLRALVISAKSDKFFVAGADISQFPELKRESGIAFVERQQNVFNKIDNLKIPVICSINGFALGGGLELALSCDIRVASENAKLGVPEVSLGIIPGLGGTQRLPRAVSVSYAKMMIFTGDPIDATEALRVGLVQKVVEKGMSKEVATSIAKKITSKGPMAIAGAKKVISDGVEEKLSDGLKMEIDCIGDLFDSEDKNEGASAFLEKRKPNFVGK